jgi:hypothetical protein
MKRKFLVCSLALVLARMLIGCGSPGSPAPPSLNLPEPVTDLSAARVGDSVQLAWPMPKRTTDRIPLRPPVNTQICRAVESGACTPIANLKLAPGAAGAYSDVLPPDLVRGPDRLLRYQVTLQNHAGKSAGASNAVYSAAGGPPAALTGLTCQVRQDGVLLGWPPVPDPGRSLDIRIERELLTPPAAGDVRRSPLAPAATPVRQTLVVHTKDGMDPGHALDTTALFNQRYRYTVERVVTLSPGGHSMEIQGQASQPIEVATKDTFPPAVPQGLAAVADSAAGAIDLSWYPDTDSDLAGYRLYRRDLQGQEPVHSIASLGVETSYRDSGVEAGHTYAYSVSAVDQSGNESSRSPEVNEILPSR